MLCLQMSELCAVVFFEGLVLSAAVCKVSLCSVTAFIHGVIAHNDNTSQIYLADIIKVVRGQAEHPTHFSAHTLPLFNP